MADLSETTVVLPSAPSPEEIALYLHLMAHFGQQTGYPALRVTVDGPGVAIDKGRDYLILGAIASQPAFSSLGPMLPLTVDSSGVHVKPATGYLARASSLEESASRWFSSLFGRSTAQNLPSNQPAVPDAMVEEIPSPASPGRSIVLVSLRENSSADEFAGVFLDRSQFDRHQWLGKPAAQCAVCLLFNR